MKLRTSVSIGAVLAILAVLAAAVWFATQDAEKTIRRAVVEVAVASESASVGTSTAFPADAALSAAAVAESMRAPLVKAKWGSKRGELGHARPLEGNPEGPSSLAFAGRDLVVLDQVNGRAVRYDPRGNVISTFDAPITAQEIAVALDGTTALLDRLSAKTITLTDPSGRSVGVLPLTGDTGLLTGVFFDGKDVYVEKEHGVLEKVGTTDGRRAAVVSTLQGRPSRDGQLLLTATLAAPAAGKVTINAFDRTKAALRFARIVQVSAPARSILLLDTDRNGIIYLGVAGGDPETANVACLEPKEGKVIGRVQLPTSVSPEESFRDLTVSDDGLIAYTLRDDDGVSYQTAHCP